MRCLKSILRFSGIYSILLLQQFGLIPSIHPALFRFTSFWTVAFWEFSAGERSGFVFSAQLGLPKILG
jgi:hypothetical protein